MTNKQKEQIPLAVQFPCLSRSALALAEDEQLRRFVLCWERSDVKWKRPRRKIAGSDNASWFAMWGNFTIDRDRLSAESGIRKTVVSRCFEMARSLRLIYPDGSISAQAAAVLDALAQGVLISVAEKAEKLKKARSAK